MRIHVTGATGFVGKHFVDKVIASGHEVVALVRSPQPHLASQSQRVVGDIAEQTDWSQAVAGADAIVHLAARVHIMRDDAAIAEEAYERVNTTATLSLAQAAADAGVRRFVFASSIKVNGDLTTDTPFSAASTPAPVDPYGRSKHHAEIGLAQIAKQSALEVAVLRPTVVYGAGVGGNIRRIARAVQRGVPLPLGAIDNRRTMVAVENVVTGIFAACEGDIDGFEVFLIGDEEPLSTRRLVELLAEGFGKKARLVRVPPAVLLFAGWMLRRGADIERLTQDLVVLPDWERLGVTSDKLVAVETAVKAFASSVNTTAEVD